MRDPVQFFKSLSKIAFLHLMFMVCLTAATAWAAIDPEPLPEDFGPAGRKQSLYLDVYRQNIHEEWSHFIRLNEDFRHIKRGDLISKDVNNYDEVPDSLFFTNRQGRSALGNSALKSGPEPDGQGSPQAGAWKVLKGKSAGVNRGMFIEDGRGERYLVKFDPMENNELASAAESISSRVFYAAGYNVPEYHVVYFKREDLTAQPNATYYADSGFKKPLEGSGIDEILSEVPQLADGRYRASASRLLKGKVLGRDNVKTRRRSDPNDPYWHRDMRSYRALSVFASWVNYYDLVPQNLMEVIENVNGRHVVKHYVIDFGSTLGSAGRGTKPPAYGFEHLFDYGEMAKSIFSLGFYNKPWYKRVEQQNENDFFSSLGNFDNIAFDPGAWKTQLPVYAFKELTNSDAFWAAKIIMSFSDEDVRALVETGQLSDPQASKKLVDILLERRDMIGKYWFGKVSPLDQIDFTQEGTNLSVSFTDLSERFHFATPQDTNYRYVLYSGTTRKNKAKVSEGESPDQPLRISSGNLSGAASTVAVYARNGSSSWLPPVLIELKDGKIVKIFHS